MEKQKYLVRRNMLVDNKPVNEGDVIEVEADRVSYLTAQGWLVEAPADDGKKKKAQKADKVEQPAADPSPTPEPETAPEQTGE